MGLKMNVLGATTLSLMMAMNAEAATKNVIILVADGAGYNTHLATEYYQGRKAAYDNAQWNQFGTST